MNPVMVWGLCAGVPAVALEYLYRTLPGTWLSNLWIYAIPSLFISYSIYRMVTVPGTSLLDAMIVWALCTAGLRIAASMYLGDDIRTGTWIAFGLVLLANLVKHIWRT